MTSALFVLGVLSFNILLTEWLVRHTALKHLGTALLVILVTAVTSNLGIIPTNATAAPIYDGIFEYVAPFAIFLPLLQVSLKSVLKAGLPMIGTFLIGSLGTAVGVAVAMTAVGGPQALGESYAVLGGMFTGTYTGGSVNFNAIALHYDFVREGLLYTGTIAVDNILTTVWMIVTLTVPRLLRMSNRSETTTPAEPVPDWSESDQAVLSPFHLGILVGMGCLSLWASNQAAAWIAATWGLEFPSILILTTIALVLGQFPAIHNLEGHRPLGMFAVYLFLAVIGAYCDLVALGSIGSLAVTLLLFAGLTVAIHGLITFGIGRLVSSDWDMLSIASQANVGGATSALALARGLNREDLLLPAILVGSLGYAVGTYLGFLMVEFIL